MIDIGRKLCVKVKMCVNHTQKVIIYVGNKLGGGGGVIFLGKEYVLLRTGYPITASLIKIVYMFFNMYIEYLQRSQVRV